MACTARGCDSCASRAAEVVSASHSMCVLVVQVASRLTVSQWPITRAPQKHFDVLQARVAMWEHVRRWRGSHACSVHDERALHARGRVQRVQGAARRAWAWQWRGEARCATCLFARILLSLLFLLYSKNAMRAYNRGCTSRAWLVCQLSLLGVAAATATPVASCTQSLIFMGRKPFTEEAKERRRIKTMESLLPAQMLDVKDDAHQPPFLETNHRECYYISSDSRTGPETNYTARSSSNSHTTAVSASGSSFTQPAPTMDDGGQRATSKQVATAKQEHRHNTVLSAIGRSLSNTFWLDFIILLTEEMLEMLRIIRSAKRPPSRPPTNSD